MVYCWYHSRNEKKVNIRTWKLAYTPKNPILDRIMGDVTKLLALDGFIGVQSSKEMENILLDQDLIAGIEFHHPMVRLTSTSFCHVYSIILAVCEVKFSSFLFRTDNI